MASTAIVDFTLGQFSQTRDSNAVLHIDLSSAVARSRIAALSLELMRRGLPCLVSPATKQDRSDSLLSADGGFQEATRLTALSGLKSGDFVTLVRKALERGGALPPAGPSPGPQSPSEEVVSAAVAGQLSFEARREALLGLIGARLLEDGYTPFRDGFLRRLGPMKAANTAALTPNPASAAITPPVAVDPSQPYQAAYVRIKLMDAPCAASGMHAAAAAVTDNDGTSGLRDGETRAYENGMGASATAAAATGTGKGPASTISSNSTLRLQLSACVVRVLPFSHSDLTAAGAKLGSPVPLPTQLSDGDGGGGGGGDDSSSTVVHDAARALLLPSALPVAVMHLIPQQQPTSLLVQQQQEHHPAAGSSGAGTGLSSSTRASIDSVIGPSALDLLNHSRYGAPLPLTSVGEHESLLQLLQLPPLPSTSGSSSGLKPSSQQQAPPCYPFARIKLPSPTNGVLPLSAGSGPTDVVPVTSLLRDVIHLRSASRERGEEVLRGVIACLQGMRVLASSLPPSAVGGISSSSSSGDSGSRWEAAALAYLRHGLTQEVSSSSNTMTDAYAVASAAAVSAKAPLIAPAALASAAVAAAAAPSGSSAVKGKAAAVSSSTAASKGKKGAPIAIAPQPTAPAAGAAPAAALSTAWAAPPSFEAVSSLLFSPDAPPKVMMLGGASGSGSSGIISGNGGIQVQFAKGLEEEENIMASSAAEAARSDSGAFGATVVSAVGSGGGAMAVPPSAPKLLTTSVIGSTSSAAVASSSTAKAADGIAAIDPTSRLGSYNTGFVSGRSYGALRKEAAPALTSAIGGNAAATVEELDEGHVDVSMTGGGGGPSTINTNASASGGSGLVKPVVATLGVGGLQKPSLPSKVSAVGGPRSIGLGSSGGGVRKLGGGLVPTKPVFTTAAALMASMDNAATAGVSGSRSMAPFSGGVTGAGAGTKAAAKPALALTSPLVPALTAAATAVVPSSVGGGKGKPAVAAAATVVKQTAAAVASMPKPSPISALSVASGGLKKGAPAVAAAAVRELALSSDDSDSDDDSSGLGSSSDDDSAGSGSGAAAIAVKKAATAAAFTGLVTGKALLAASFSSSSSSAAAGASSTSSSDLRDWVLAEVDSSGSGSGCSGANPLLRWLAAGVARPALSPLACSPSALTTSPASSAGSGGSIGALSSIIRDLQQPWTWPVLLFHCASPWARGRPDLLPLAHTPLEIVPSSSSSSSSSSSVTGRAAAVAGLCRPLLAMGASGASSAADHYGWRSGMPSSGGSGGTSDWAPPPSVPAPLIIRLSTQDDKERARLEGPDRASALNGGGAGGGSGMNDADPSIAADANAAEIAEEKRREAEAVKERMAARKEKAAAKAAGKAGANATADGGAGAGVDDEDDDGGSVDSSGAPMAKVSAGIKRKEPLAGGGAAAASAPTAKKAKTASSSSSSAVAAATGGVAGGGGGEDDASLAAVVTSCGPNEAALKKACEIKHLKAFCRLHKQPVSGTKGVLIERALVVLAKQASGAGAVKASGAAAGAGGEVGGAPKAAVVASSVKPALLAPLPLVAAAAAAVACTSAVPQPAVAGSSSSSSGAGSSTAPASAARSGNAAAAVAAGKPGGSGSSYNISCSSSSRSDAGVRGGKGPSTGMASVAADIDSSTDSGGLTSHDDSDSLGSDSDDSE